MRLLVSVFSLMVIILSGCNSAPRLDYDQTQKSSQKYHDQLKAFRSEFRELEQPDVRFYLFGMGNRRKLLYKNGKIKDALTGAIVEQWDIAEETIVPNAYTVLLKNSDGQSIIIFENEEAVWVQAEKTTKIKGTGAPIHLPDFKGHKYSEILKVLHQELLINVIESKPLPNYFVYKKPWRRDAAMMAMCFEKTGNTSLIREWILSIDDPYDHNNGQMEGRPEYEADNLGQTLYLISLFSNSKHAVVPKVMEEIKRFEVQDKDGRYIQGRSDFHYVPVYQTKWLKFGLKSLGMEDPYTIPMIPCDYSALFWWGYKDKDVKLEGWRSDRYPYIGWARDHFYREKRSPISNRDYPLTWEQAASEADYSGMEIIDSVYVQQRISAPHTWHAAEVFLYLLDEDEI